VPAESRPTVDADFLPLDPRVRTLWTIGSAGPVMLLAIAATVALVLLDAAGALVTTIAVAGLACAIGAAVWARLAWKRWRWSAGSRALELRHGVVILRASVVPYHRLQQIDVVRGPLERLLGLATLTLRTAAATSDARIPGIDAESADEVRRRLLERAGRDDAV
jgi:membrane protein YdbS with pleckstrin-like domain